MNAPAGPDTGLAADSPAASPAAFGQVLLSPALAACHDGRDWTPAAWQALEALTVPLAGPAVQYGLSVFEGLKAYRGADGAVRLFRAEAHARRLQFSARRLGLPSVPEDRFLAACEAVVERHRDAVPDHGRGALYLRPTVWALDATLGLRPAQRHGFAVAANPCADPGWRHLRLWAEPDLVRAAPGGLGAVKTAANYAAGLAGLLRAREHGFDDVLWLDAVEHRALCEAGSMNVFAEIDGVLVTPELDGTLLAGVTRAEVLALAQRRGLRSESRRLTLDELLTAQACGQLGSLFGTGTAARLVAIDEIANRSLRIRAGEPRLARQLFADLKAVQEGDAPAA